MTRTEIIEKLKEEGYEFEKTEIVKNGVTKKAIQPAGKAEIKPVIYTDYLIGCGMGIDDVVESVILTYKHSLDRIGRSIVEKLENIEELMKNLKIILQKHEDDMNLRKKTIYEGIDAVMVTEIDMGEETGIVKIKRDMSFPKDEEKLWKIAEENTFKEFNIFPMSEIFPEDIPPMIEEFLWIITNKERHMGAAQALNVEAISKWAKSKGINSLIMIPCSVHEFIAMPGDEEELERIGNIATQVNRDVVEEEERLADNAYVLKIE